MTEDHEKALSIFRPYYLQRAHAAKKTNLRFVQYTSAESLMNLLRTQEIWLRNTRCMNDYMEVEHGLDCLITTFTNEKNGSLFKDTIENLFPGILKEFTQLFDGWIPAIKSSTYIGCVSEHPYNEDLYGRLSMWRAYGGKQSVAVVLNPGPFFRETDVFHAYTHPVQYLDLDNFGREFHELAVRINSNVDFVENLGKQGTINYLFYTFMNFATSIKHPGFEEEREWRVVYNPDLKRSDHVKSSIVSINNVPQEIHKIPLKDIPEGNFYGASIRDFIDRIIIGPNDHQSILRKTFISLLREAGCKNPEAKVAISGIPLR